MRIKRLSGLLSLICLGASTVAYAHECYPGNFSLSDVTIKDPTLSHAMELNLEVLKQYDTDRLLQPFLREAGIPTDAVPFDNWADLSGHVGGHYLSALAIHYAATGDKECLDRLNYMLDELDKCQKAAGDGRICAMPHGEECFEQIKDGNVDIVWKYWVPWYNVHKTYAGLRDAYLYTGNQKALQMFLDLCDWGIGVIDNLTPEQMESMLNNEFGGMNEVYADAYDLTGDEKYLDAAIKFTHHWLFDSMVEGVDNLDNKHANTQVPKAVGFQRVAEACRKAGRNDLAVQYQKAADFFWNTVVYNRSLAIGGNSRREHFASASDCISYAEEREGPETCNTYNMLKLAEGLHRMDPRAEYADFYERAMYNHILSTQHPEHGGYVYFTSARPDHYRVYSQPNQAMWCCVGTGMENHGKYGEFIYTHDGDSLWVNLFTPSTVNWSDKGLKVDMDSDFPHSGNVRLTVNTEKPTAATIYVRHPRWCKDGKMTAVVDGKDYAKDSNPSSYVKIDRVWNNGDNIDITMDMDWTLEEMPNLPYYVAIMRGPIVMGAATSTDDLYGLVADDGRWSHIAHGRLTSIFDTPMLIGEKEELIALINNNAKEVEGKPMHYTVEGLLPQKWSALELQPFSSIHDSRYMMYWLSMPQDEYVNFELWRKADEQLALALDARTIDAVTPGEQQPEADHGMKSEKSQKGIHVNFPWRAAEADGFFEYTLDPQHLDNLSLMIKCDNDPTKALMVQIDGVELPSPTVNNPENADFSVLEYQIPTSMVQGKDTIRVRFSGKDGKPSQPVYNLRLCK